MFNATPQSAGPFHSQGHNAGNEAVHYFQYWKWAGPSCIKTSCKNISGLTRVAVKMLKPHHNGSEHAEADLLSEYNLLKEVRQFLLYLEICNFSIFVFFRAFIKQTKLLVTASLTGNEPFFLQLRLYNMFWWVNVVRHVFDVFKVLCSWNNIFIIFSALFNGNLRIHIWIWIWIYEVF